MNNIANTAHRIGLALLLACSGSLVAAASGAQTKQVLATATVQFATASTATAEAASLQNLLSVTTGDGQPTTAPFTVTLSVTGGTASASDYANTGTVTIPAGTANGSTLSISSAFGVIDDSAMEANETVQLSLSAPTGIGGLGLQTTHVHTINNDETATLDGSVSGVAEGVGTAFAPFTLLITGTTASAGSMGIAGSFDAYTVELVGSTAATSGLDFGAISNGALTIPIPVGSTHGQVFQVPVSIVDDALVEEGEFFDVQLDHGVNIDTIAPGHIQHTLRINASDPATITWVSASSTAAETIATHPVNAVLTINSSPSGGSLENAVTVAISASNGTATGADYSLSSTSITFPAGSVSGATQTVNAAIVADGLGEGDQTFSLAFGAVTSAGTNTTAAGTHTVTITEATTVQFAAFSSSGAEASSLGNIVVVNTADGSPTSAAFTVTVSVTGGTATAADYALSGTLTVPAGTASGAALSIASAFSISDDSVLEDNETVQLTLSAPTGGVRLGARTSYIRTIVDDETATITGSTPGFVENVGTANVPFTLQVTGTTASAGSMGIAGSFDAYTVQLVGANAATSNVDYTAISNGALTIAIPIGTTSGQSLTVPVAIINDDLVEEAEFFDVVLDHGVNVSTGAAGSIQSTVRISASDTATVTWSNATSIAPETTTPHAVTAVLTINSTPSGGSLENAVTIAISASNGTATAADFSLSTTSITFPAGSVSGATRTVNTAIVSDGLGEGDQTFSLAFGAVTSAGTNTTATGTHTVTITENNRLQFLQQPTSALTNTPITPAPTVRILDSAGNLTSTTAAVTLAIANNPAGGTLSGITTVNAVAGIATFSGLSINNAGTGYTLSASSSGLTGATSTAFNISCPATVVSIGNDSGAGSLRQIIADACANSTITFAPGVTTVNLSSAQVSINKNLTLDGGAGVTLTRVAGSPNFRILDITSGTIVLLDNLNISNGSVAGFGGGIQNAGDLTVQDAVISGNASTGSFGGGGIANNGGTLVISNSTLSGNSAAGIGGALAMPNGGSAILTRSTLSGNSAQTGGAILARSQGAATSLNVSNCTISNNTASSAGPGIHIQAESGGNATLTLLNSTVAAHAGAGSPVLTQVVSGTASSSLRNNIYADNAGTNVASSGGGTNNSLGNNLSDDASGGGGPGDLINTSALLAPLGSYAGSTLTHALLPGSPAIDAGSNTGAPSMDQRGVARPQFGTVDIGAYESRGFGLSLSSGNNQTAGPGQAFANPLVLSVAALSVGEPVNGGEVSFSAPVSGASASFSPVNAVISGNSASSQATANASIGSYSVSASARGASTPVNFSLNNAGANVTIDDVSMTEGDAGSSNAVFTVTRSNATTAFTVPYSVSAGTAVAGSDYTSVSGSLVFAAGGALTQIISVPVLSDTTVEGSESATVNIGPISNSVGTTTIIDGSGALTISDNDHATVSFSPLTVAQSEASSPMNFVVTLSNPVQSGVSLSANTLIGTASNADFIAVFAAPISFAANSTSSQTVSVTIQDDALDELDETFSVVLSGLSAVGNVSLGNDTATGTILDDDPEASVTTILSHTPTATVVGESYAVQVQVSGTTSAPSGSVSVSDGSATCGPVVLVATTATTSAATCNLVSTNIGTKTMVASYVPDNALHTSSSSPGVTHVVTAATTAVTVHGPARSRIGQATSFAVELTVVAPGAGTPVGTITLSSGADSCSVILPTATPECALTFATLGPRTISAQFASSDGNFLAATSQGSANVETMVYALSDLAVSKTDAVTTYVAGDALTYTIIVDNIGPDAAAQVRLVDLVPGELGSVTWTCTSSGGVSCPLSAGNGNLDLALAVFPVGAQVIATVAGTVIGSPSEISNTAMLGLPADATIDDPQVSNNAATDIDRLAYLFQDSFEGGAQLLGKQALPLPTDALRALLDPVARMVFEIEDNQGPAARVYARKVNDLVQYRLARRDALGTWEWSDWLSDDDEPILTWTVQSEGDETRLQSVDLR
ncbi:Calx-beta domain-containing protein [Ahniella affigens]|nr:Calx-beta domain-containing protein [Ahniella affigens]